MINLLIYSVDKELICLLFFSGKSVRIAFNTTDLLTNTAFTRSQIYQDRDLDCDLDCDLDRNLDCNPEDILIYTGHSLFNTTKHITLLFIVQSLLHCNPPNIWIKIIQIEFLHGTKFLDPDRDPDNFAPCKLGIRNK